MLSEVYKTGLKESIILPIPDKAGQKSTTTGILSLFNSSYLQHPDKEDFLYFSFLVLYIEHQ